MSNLAEIQADLTNLKGFAGAIAGGADSAATYNPSDAASTLGATGALTSLVGSVVSLVTSNPALLLAANAIGFQGAQTSLAADVQAYKDAIAFGSATGQISAWLGILSDS